MPKVKASRKCPVALTVAGSDSGGGAGIQADLKTFHAVGVFGTCAITCVTAQNPGRVSVVQAITPHIVAEQLDRVFEAFHIAGAKTGMLYDAAIIETVAHAFRRRRFTNLVVDPVMVASSGAMLLKRDAVTALSEKLLPCAAVVTPNRAEAEVLSRQHIRTLDEQRAAACLLAEQFGAPFLVKGGHLRRATQAVDILFDGRRLYEFAAPIVRGIKTHGTGCTLSAAIAAYLALGHRLPEAVHQAKALVTAAIRHAIRLGKYQALRI